MRFGIIGASKIAGSQFIPSTRAFSHVSCQAVACRSVERGRKFATEHGIQRVFGSYEELLDSELVDCVYIALPNALHFHWCMQALDRGLHVLCEKPIATEPTQAREICDKAEEQRVVCMDGYHTFSHPLNRTLISQTQLRKFGGTIIFDMRNCTPQSHLREDDIRKSAALGGGVLLDLCSYSIYFLAKTFEKLPVDIELHNVRYFEDSGTQHTESEIHFTLHYQDSKAHIYGSLVGDEPYEFSLAVHGDIASLKMKNHLFPQWMTSEEHGITMSSLLGADQGLGHQNDLKYGQSSYIHHLGAFSSSVLTNQRNTTSSLLRASITMLEVVERIKKLISNYK
mmetsp:Transcript_15114/g.51773  ORF Transcript_15114/g.51773 Transcript_15114/m.51773 type:complete len:340 (-) Transcript_15114:190-1209(-)